MSPECVSLLNAETAAWFLAVEIDPKRKILKLTVRADCTATDAQLLQARERVAAGLAAEGFGGVRVVAERRGVAIGE